MRVRIIAVPLGEAPEEIRRAWVGLTLPLMHGEDGPANTVGLGGVLSAPKTMYGAWWRILTGRTTKQNGYRVPAAPSIDILQRAAPEAAAWWKENVPLVLKKGATLIFDTNSCEEVE